MLLIFLAQQTTLPRDQSHKVVAPTLLQFKRSLTDCKPFIVYTTIPFLKCKRTGSFICRIFGCRAVISPGANRVAFTPTSFLNSASLLTLPAEPATIGENAGDYRLAGNYGAAGDGGCRRCRQLSALPAISSTRGYFRGCRRFWSDCA